MDVRLSVIELLKQFTEEWGVDHHINLSSRIVADLEFESIDIIQLIVAIEQHFSKRNMGFEDLLMHDGRYVDDLTVEQIAQFVEGRLAPVRQSA